MQIPCFPGNEQFIDIDCFKGKCSGSLGKTAVARDSLIKVHDVDNDSLVNYVILCFFPMHC